MKAMLARLCERLGLEWIEQPEATRLCIHKSGGLAFHVTVPHEVLEWFVDVHDDAGEIWSDWADYPALDGETRDQLAAGMAGDIERMVTTLAASQARVWSDQATSAKRVELQLGADWRAMSMAI